ncbi:MAG TPA: hypothetical protein VFA20_11750 [Myxococcaceae bacterium]|nr:hypothetical protein [Myxococcaceae bacterium]
MARAGPRRIAWRARMPTAGVGASGAARAGSLRIVAALALMLATAGACLVPPFDPTGRGCSLPAHPCPDGFDCVQGRCARAAERLQVTALPPGAVLAGTCGTAEVVVLQLDGGTPASATVVALEVDGGMRLFSDTACQQEMPQVTVPVGVPDASFSFFALRGGRYAIFASAGSSTAQIDQDVSPMVRSGRCSIVDGQQEVLCPVTPPVLDTGRAFALFQTATQETYPGDSGVRCLLSDPATLGCQRTEFTGHVDVHWQVAEVPGASVFPAGPALCVARGSFGAPLPAVVDLGSTFLLFSEHRAGANYGTDDFSTAELGGPSTVLLDSAAGCTSLGTYGIQAVSLPGASVIRGATGPMDAGVSTLDVQVSAPAPQGRTVLLHTHRYAGSAIGPICSKVVRGEVLDAAGTTLRFSRSDPPSVGCTGPNLDVDGIAWERIQVPPGDRLQRFVVDLAASQMETTVPIAAVDPTRTVVLAGGQGSAGQALGETRDTTTLDPRVASLALELDPSGTSFRASRTASGDASRWTVYVWEFGPSP